VLAPLRDSPGPLFPPTDKQPKQKAAFLKAVEKHTAAAEAAKRWLAEEDGVDADAPRGASAEVSKLGFFETNVAFGGGGV